MSISITQLAQKSIYPSVGGGLNSGWNAVHNPILFKFQRQDLDIDHILIDSGTETLGKVYPDGLPDDGYSLLAEGDIVSVTGNATIADGWYTTTDIQSDHFSILLPAGYTAGTYSGGTLNLITTLKNYRLEVKIGLVIAGVFTPFITTAWVPDGTGYIEVDVAPYLKPKLGFTNGYNYTDLNVADTQLSNIFSVSIRQVWTGHDDEVFANLGNYYFTNSAKQPGDKYGANMAEFVPFNNADASIVRAKFLTGFKHPHCWPAYPFDLSFIWQEGFASAITRYTVKKDINGNGSAAVGADLDLHPKFINRMKISDQDLTGSFTDVFLKSGSSGFVISEILRVALHDDCEPNPVFLCWKNKNGAWDYWRFGWNQTKKRNTGDTKQFEPYITEFADVNSRIKTTSKSSAPSMVLGASGVSNDDIYYNEQYTGLMGLMDSVEVLMLKNPDTWEDDGPVWVTVTPKVGSLKAIDTRSTNGNVELEILLPYLQIETQ